jgi:hypothetical protein
MPPSDWAFGFSVTAEHVWDGFVILALLEDCQHRSKTLVVPHTGAQKDCFTAALHARNHRFRVHGQPELRHHCNKCFRLYDDGRKVWVVVIDGVTIGFPCCVVHNCKIPLANSRHDRFCPQHSDQNKICVVVEYHSPTSLNSHVCSDPQHQQVEKIHHGRGQARFQLRERLQRARVAHPNDAVAKEVNLTELIDADDEEEEFEIPIAHNPEAAPKKRIWAKFGRKRTHNEQIIVAPCGMIIAQETFYGAEGVASVIVSK